MLVAMCPMTNMAGVLAMFVTTVFVWFVLHVAVVWDYSFRWNRAGIALKCQNALVTDKDAGNPNSAEARLKSNNHRSVWVRVLFLQAHQVVWEEPFDALVSPHMASASSRWRRWCEWKLFTWHASKLDRPRPLPQSTFWSIRRWCSKWLCPYLHVPCFGWNMCTAEFRSPVRMSASCNIHSWKLFA